METPPEKKIKDKHIMKKKICVVTGTRAEYHLLYPLLRAIENDSELELLLAVTGSHLSEKYGSTYHDIEKDGFKIKIKIPILQEQDSPNEINFAMGKAIQGFSSYLKKSTPDMVVLLGDRYELLSAAIASMNFRIPIAHLHGGETTQGAIDECIRHAITKMSYLHFTSCEVHRRRVIQLGENPERVFNVGAIGLENIRNQKYMSLDELEQSLNFKLGNRFAIVTFHPVTLEYDTSKDEFQQLLNALSKFQDLKIIFTKSNADTGGLAINRMIDEYVSSSPTQCTAVFSLGMVRYLTALRYASVVIGNSSSGIIETPSFCVPTVNIGDRQKGRMQAKNILNCPPKEEEIHFAIDKALSEEFHEYVKDTISPFGDGIVSSKILYNMKYFLKEGNIDLKKSFYDIRVYEEQQEE